MTVFCTTCNKKMSLSIKQNFLNGIWIYARCKNCKTEYHSHVEGLIWKPIGQSFTKNEYTIPAQEPQFDK